MPQSIDGELGEGHSWAERAAETPHSVTRKHPPGCGAAEMHLSFCRTVR
jgi:hypothetical protein